MKTIKTILLGTKRQLSLGAIEHDLQIYQVNLSQQPIEVVA